MRNGKSLFTLLPAVVLVCFLMTDGVSKMTMFLVMP